MVTDRSQPRPAWYGLIQSGSAFSALLSLVQPCSALSPLTTGCQELLRLVGSGAWHASVPVRGEQHLT